MTGHVATAGSRVIALSFWGSLGADACGGAVVSGAACPLQDAAAGMIEEPERHQLYHNIAPLKGVVLPKSSSSWRESPGCHVMSSC